MKSKWKVNSDDVEILVINTWFKGDFLYVNGELQDERNSRYNATLTGHYIDSKQNKRLIKVNLGGFWKVKCTIFIDDKKVEEVKINR